MPHCIVEHSSQIEGKALMPLVFEGALASGLFEVDGSDIKVRALAFDNFYHGDGAQKFVHVTLKILSGRSVDQKVILSNMVLEKLKTLDGSNRSITVEVVDIERATYTKAVT